MVIGYKRVPEPPARIIPFTVLISVVLENVFFSNDSLLPLALFDLLSKDSIFTVAKNIENTCDIFKKLE